MINKKKLNAFIRKSSKKKDIDISIKETKNELEKIKVAGTRSKERQEVINFMGMSGLFDTYKSYRIDGFAPNSAYNKTLNHLLPRIRKTKRENFGNRY